MESKPTESVSLHGLGMHEQLERRSNELAGLGNRSNTDRTGSEHRPYDRLVDDAAIPDFRSDNGGFGRARFSLPIVGTLPLGSDSNR